MSRQRRLGVVGVVAGVLLLTACGGDGEEDFLACLVPAAPTGGAVGESLRSQPAAAGLAAAGEQPGIATRRFEPATPEEYPGQLTDAVDAGCDAVIAVGEGLATATAEAAAAHPDRQFALVDGGSPEPANVYAIRFEPRPAAMLAGYLAAGLSETGVVATYGAVAADPVTTLLTGFADGVAHFNDVTGAEVRLLGWDPEAEQGVFTGDVDDPAAGRAASDPLVADGADVVMPVAGPAGLGTAEAAGDGGYLVIWAGLDGLDGCAGERTAVYCPVFVSSVVQQVAQAVHNSVLRFAAADALVTGELAGTLENHGVGLAPYRDLADRVPIELRTDLIELEADIVDGTISYPPPAGD